MADNYLQMSDEEMMNATPPEVVNSAIETIEQPISEQPATEETIIQPTGEVQEPVEEQDQQVEENEESTLEDEDGAPAPAKDDKEIPEDNKKEEKETVDTPVLDYEAEYKKILAPFKANGREVTPKSVEDAISLMQMGANYNKKMAALKPNLKLMKLLENNGLLDESKLSFLIDLDKKSPEAITKLIKDSGIDPLDLDTKATSTYAPTIHKVDDREIELDAVLEDIQSTPSYSRTLEIVSKEWDAKSKQAVANAPKLLNVINDHVSSGIYDIIVAEMDSERVFGRLEGMSDIEAYRMVGDKIESRGGFNHLNKTNATNSVKPTIVVAPKPKVDAGILNDKRRAAAGNKTVVTAKASEDFNPLAMSDAEFMKITDARFR